MTRAAKTAAARACRRPDRGRGRRRARAVACAAVERYYSRGFYPAIQQLLTPASNLVPIALLDLAVIAVLVVVFFVVRADARRLARGRTVVARITAAVVYIVFVLLWGLNYRRVPLERNWTSIARG